MIYLLTGTPGSGKTLSAIALIRKQQQEDPNRVIYAANIRGLNIPGVLELAKDDVLRWHEICEKGSLIVVDEAQRYWRASRSGGVDDSIVELETHRHDGIDIVMITQHPGLIHANIRKLVNRHIHLVAFTDHSALRWEAREVREDVQDPSFRANADFEEWKYPQEMYALYDSAEKHTKQIEVSWRERFARHGKKVTVGIFVIAALGVALFMMKVKDGTFTGSAKPAADTSASGQGRELIRDPSRDNGRQPKYRTMGDYVAAQIPRVASQPWSAPIYDDQHVTTHPQIFCVAKADDSDCHCITEQGTRYNLGKGMCLDIAKNGPAYDPFKPERRRDDTERPREVHPSTPELSEPVLAENTRSHDVRAAPGTLPTPAALSVVSKGGSTYPLP